MSVSRSVTTGTCVVESTDKFTHDDTVKFVTEVGIFHAAIDFLMADLR